MKGFGMFELKKSEEQPPDAIESVTFCLEQLANDMARDMSENVVDNLTFEELIGALVAAKKELKGMYE